MNEVTKVTQQVYAALDGLHCRWAALHDRFEECGLDDYMLAQCGRDIRAARDKVSAVAMLSHWTDGYVRNGDMTTDILMNDLEGLPAKFQRALDVQEAVLEGFISA